MTWLTVRFGSANLDATTFNRLGPSAKIRRYCCSLVPRPSSSICSSPHACCRWSAVIDGLPQRPAYPMARLQQAQCQPGRTFGPLGDLGHQGLVDAPAQGSATMTDDLAEFLFAVEFVPQNQLHSVPKRLEQAKFIRACQE